MRLPLTPGYCVDTSAWIDLWRRYPLEFFHDLWAEIERLARQGELGSPREARHELLRGHDGLAKWATEHESLFFDPDSEQIGLASELLERHPGFLDFDKEGPDADIWVVAMAIQFGWAVVTSERPARPGARKRIPDMCAGEGTACMGVFGLFRELHIAFTLDGSTDAPTPPPA